MAANMDLAVLGLEIRSDGVVVASNRLRDLERQSGDTARAATNMSNNVTGGFKNMLKAATALLGAYTALSKMRSFMSRGLEFNSNLETSRIGIGTLITSMTQLADAQGNVLQGAEKYAASQQLAAEMMKEIQRLGLETTATTESLVSGVQSIMGPALQAGMALKDIPKFAVQGAQAMQTLGVPLEQMRTELEALLSGNVNKAQDILAPKLFSDVQGDLGAYIKGLQRSGTLVDELMRRLEPFKTAGQDMAQTWTVLVSNLQEGLDTLAGQSAKGFSQSMKEAVGSLSDLLLSSENGTVGIGQDFQAIAQVLLEIEDTIGKGILKGVQSLANAVRQFNSYLNETGVDNFFSNIERGAKVAGAAFAALILYKKQASASFTIGTGDEARQVTGLQAYVTAQRQAILAAQERTQAELRRAATARTTALADVQEFEAALRTRTANLSAAEAERVRAASSTALQSRLEALTQAESRHTAAVTAARNATLAGAASTKAMAGLSAMLGGPVGIALTAATVGITLLATRTDESALAAERLTQAEKSYSEAIKGATNETGKLNTELTKAQKLKMEIAKTDISSALESEFSKLGSIIDNISKYTPESIQQNWNPFGDMAAFNPEDVIPVSFINRVNELIAEFKQAKISGEDFKEGIAGIREEAIDAGHAQSVFVKEMEEISRNGNAIDALIQLQNRLAEVEGASKGAASGIRILKNEANGIGAVLNEALKKSSLDAYVAGLGKKQQAVAKGLANELKLGEEQIKDVFSGKEIEGLDSDKLKQYMSNLETIYTAGQSGKKSGSGGVSKVATATENIRRIRDEIDQLSGTADKATAAMNKKMVEIAKLGKEAGVSSNEILKLKNEYQEAFKTNALREFDKELLKINGDTQTLRTMQVEETMLAWADKFDAAGLSAEEAAPKLEKMQAALDREHNYEDLQVVANFYKELADLSGNYSTSIEYQNRLIEQQAQAWERAGIPLKDIEERVRLMKQELSKDPLEGIARGMSKYGKDGMDMAKGLEDAVQSAFKGMEDAFVSFANTGKLSFEDMANSIINDLIRIAVKSAITGPLASGIGNLFGSFFGGSSGGFTGPISSGGSTVGWAVNSMPMAGFKNGGVLSGGNISDYSNSIIDTPTTFSYSGHLNKFASGAGLMGEAGAEAVMPLKRLPDRSLGVKALLPKDSGGANIAAIQMLAHSLVREQASNSGIGRQDSGRVAVNIYNQTDSRVSASSTTDNNGNVDLKIMVEKVVGDSLSRPGSAPFRALQNTWQGSTSLANR